MNYVLAEEEIDVYRRQVNEKFPNGIKEMEIKTRCDGNIVEWVAYNQWNWQGFPIARLKKDIGNGDIDFEFLN